MLHALRKVIKNTMPGLHTTYRMACGTDYRILSEYIMNINRLRKIEDFARLAAGCLKELLDYDFFGLAIQKQAGIFAWLDPADYRDAFLRVLRNDFPGQKIDISFQNLDYKTGASANFLPLTEVIAVNDGTGHPAYIYFASGKASHPYFRDILNIVTKTAVCAIQNALTIESLQGLAVMDPVTDCYNRAALSGHLEHAVASAKRYGTDLSLIIFDLDRFKSINDIYGHHAGDMALRETAKTVMTSIRKSDCLSRYGGDEFILLLPNTNLFVAVSLAERLRRAIGSLSIKVNERSVRLTASFGVASLREGGSAESLLREADEMLYRSKARGRNTVSPHTRRRQIEQACDIAVAR